MYYKTRKTVKQKQPKKEFREDTPMYKLFKEKGLDMRIISNHCYGHFFKSNEVKEHIKGKSSSRMFKTHSFNGYEYSTYEKGNPVYGENDILKDTRLIRYDFYNGNILRKSFTGFVNLYISQYGLKHPQSLDIVFLDTIDDIYIYNSEYTMVGYRKRINNKSTLYEDRNISDIPLASNNQQVVHNWIKSLYWVIDDFSMFDYTELLRDKRKVYSSAILEEAYIIMQFLCSMFLFTQHFNIFDGDVMVIPQTIKNNMIYERFEIPYKSISQINNNNEK